MTWQGEQLPFLPYAYRHPEYWQKIQEESKAGGDKVASRLLVSFMFRAGKEHPKECRETRIDIDRRLKKVLGEW